MDHRNASWVDAKQVADFLTSCRVALAIVLAWLGVSQGSAGLSLAVYLMLFSWTTDSLDGPIARRSRRGDQSWIGSHDLEVDMAVSLGLLIYLVISGLIEPAIAGSYLLIWAFFFWRWGVPRSLGMLVQAPIYGWFIWVAVRDARPAGQWLIVWIVAALIITWPRFPREVIPDFLSGMRTIWRRRHHSD